MVGEIEEPGFLEGGDYFAAGEDLALVGVGLRSNIEACEQLMNRDWLGTDRLAVVRDDFEQHQVRCLHNCIKTCRLELHCLHGLPMPDVGVPVWMYVCLCVVLSVGHAAMLCSTSQLAVINHCNMAVLAYQLTTSQSIQF